MAPATTSAVLARGARYNAQQASAGQFDAASALHTTPKTFEGAVDLYDDWADSYDATLLGWGYEAHLKTAELLKKYTGPGAVDKPVLDVGCGTGLSGEAAAVLGYKRLVGTDCSAKSLRLLYRKTVVTEDGAAMPKIDYVRLTAEEENTLEETQIPIVSTVLDDKTTANITAAELSTLLDGGKDSGGNTKLASNSTAASPNATRLPLYHSVALCNLEEPWVFSDDSFNAVICVGVTSYVHNFAVLFKEWCRILKPGGYAIWTHRTTMWDPNENGCQDAVEAMVSAGKWEKVYVSEKSPYMPRNTVPEEAAKTIYYQVYRVK